MLPLARETHEGYKSREGIPPLYMDGRMNGWMDSIHEDPLAQ